MAVRSFTQIMADHAQRASVAEKLMQPDPVVWMPEVRQMALAASAKAALSAGVRPAPRFPNLGLGGTWFPKV